jgi:hypothetical protein
MITDDLPKLMFGGEYIRPERDSYTYTPPFNVRQSAVQGTFNRQGRDVIGGPASVSCNIKLRNPAILMWWDDFYNFEIYEGAGRFVAELFINGVIQPHVCQIISSVQSNTPGWHGTIQLKLQAIPIIDRCTSISRLMFIRCYGEDSLCFIKQLTNVALNLNNKW